MIQIIANILISGKRKDIVFNGTEAMLLGSKERALEKFEPCAGKLARTVLRGASRSNAASLLDKLHIVTNDRGELIVFKITRGNYHDSKAAVPLLKNLKGLAFGDKGYLSKKIFDELLASGLKLITRKRKNSEYCLQEDIIW